MGDTASPPEAKLSSLRNNKGGQGPRQKESPLNLRPQLREATSKSLVALVSKLRVVPFSGGGLGPLPED